MVPLGDPEALAAAVGDMVVPESTAVWLGGRSRLTLALGAPPTRIERTLRQIAAVHGLEMHGFAGPSEGGLHDLDAYDEVRDGGSVSTRPPRSRG